MVLSSFSYRETEASHIFSMAFFSLSQHPRVLRPYAQLLGQQKENSVSCSTDMFVYLVLLEDNQTNLQA